jgi:hypothetical protein
LRLARRGSGGDGLQVLKEMEMMDLEMLSGAWNSRAGVTLKA